MIPACSPLSSLIVRAVVVAVALVVSGCTTTSKRTVFKGDGIVVTHTEVTDHALKMSGHGGYILVINSAVVYGKEYVPLAGNGTCFFTVPERKLMFFVTQAKNPGTGFTPNRELHILNTETRSDTIIFLGQSEMGNDFGGHPAGSKYAERVDFESDQVLRITTYNGLSLSARTITPYIRSVFVVDLNQKKLVSEEHVHLPREQAALR
jgi:hypothetical protein